MKYNSKYIAIPPGMTIQEQLEYKNMSIQDFATLSKIDEKNIIKLINGECELTEDIALRLEEILGVQARFWLNLEKQYREKLRKIEKRSNS